ncbi:GNAT family N-acetyltransferase [Rugosimonospora africana]|uniref:GNAT family N-acetyltransferase n=1 Tax=Rugosimonospora africana TaxID=556532 RepID=UPI001942991F|nr:GNAT family protein [Rugosimonospora africana]
MSITRLIASDDVSALTALLRVNREFLAPWDPARSEDFFTTDGQQAVIRDDLRLYARGSKLPHVIVDDDGQVTGRITLNGIVRGAFQSCALSYWVDASRNGRGLATRAVREIVQVAFEDLGLHRVQAETLLHNVRSRRVLERNGFRQFGVAPEYLNIAGRWQDHAMYQVVKAPQAG